MEAERINNQKIILWYDASDKMTQQKLGYINTDLKKKIPALSRINTNYKMIKEFSYEGQPAFLFFRQGKAEEGKIKIVELYLMADEQNTRELLGFTEVTGLVYHDLGKEKEFGSIRTRLYKREGQKTYYRCNQYRLDDDTINFIIAFMANELPYKNDSALIFETTASPEIGKPYDSQ